MPLDQGWGGSRGRERHLSFTLGRLLWATKVVAFKANDMHATATEPCAVVFQGRSRHCAWFLDLRQGPRTRDRT